MTISSQINVNLVAYQISLYLLHLHRSPPPPPLPSLHTQSLQSGTQPNTITGALPTPWNIYQTAVCEVRALMGVVMMSWDAAGRLQVWCVRSRRRGDHWLMALHDANDRWGISRITLQQFKVITDGLGQFSYVPFPIVQSGNNRVWWW